MRYNEKVNEYLYLETIKRYIYLYENSFNFKPVVMEPAPLDFKGLSLKDALSAYFPKIKLPSLSDALIDCVIKRPVMAEEIKEVKLYYKPNLEALPF